MATRTQTFRPLSATSFYSHPNLVRYVSMDDLTEKNGNDLTNSGCTATTGKFSGAYSSGSSNSANRMYNSANLGINGGACTITAWIKLNSTHTVSDHPLAVSEYSSSAGILNGIGFNQGNTAVQFSRLRESIAWQDASYTYSPGTSDYHFYGYVYDGSTVKGYVDGVLVASASASGSGTNTGRVTGMSVLANDRGGIDNPCSAQADDVGFFNAALSDAEMASIYAETSVSFDLGEYFTPSLLLPFDGNSTDFSGNSFDAVPTNMAFEPGVSGSSCAVFNGTNSKEYVPFNSTLNASGAVTVGGLFNFSSLTGTKYLAMRGNLSVDWGLVIRATAGTGIEFLTHTAPNDNYLNSGFVPTAGEWFYLVCRFVPGEMSVFVNGNKIATLSVGSSLRTSASYGWTIGDNYSSGNPFDGKMDSFFIEARGWSDGEIIERGTAFRGLFATL